MICRIKKQKYMEAEGPMAYNGELMRWSNEILIISGLERANLKERQAG